MKKAYLLCLIFYIMIGCQHEENRNKRSLYFPDTFYICVGNDLGVTWSESYVLGDTHHFNEIGKLNCIMEFEEDYHREIFFMELNGMMNVQGFCKIIFRGDRAQEIANYFRANLAENKKEVLSLCEKYCKKAIS